VGYRVNSAQATHFRIWATERLRDYDQSWTITRQKAAEII